MSCESFEEANTQYYQERWMDDHPELAYMINDGNLDRYVDDIDRDIVMEDMCECYHEYIS